MSLAGRCIGSRPESSHVRWCERGAPLRPDCRGNLGHPPNNGNTLSTFPSDVSRNYQFIPGRGCSNALRTAGANSSAMNNYYNSYQTPINNSANANGVDSHLLAAVGARESGLPSDPTVVQRNGLGRGLFQIDLGAHPGVTAAQAFDPSFSANYAANILSTNMATLAAQYPNLNDAQLTQATAASYNFGTGNISGDPNTIDVGQLWEQRCCNLCRLLLDTSLLWRASEEFTFVMFCARSLHGGCLDAIAQTEPIAGLILPKIGVAGVKLGSDPSAFEAVFPQRPGHTNSAQTGTFGEGCPDELYYWSDLDVNTSKIDAYSKHGEISQLSVFGPRFSLSNGLKTGATEQTVVRAYPNGNMYVLLYSSNKVNGGRDLHYWVEEGAGIAFELAWWQSKKTKVRRQHRHFPERGQLPARRMYFAASAVEGVEAVFSIAKACDGPFHEPGPKRSKLCRSHEPAKMIYLKGCPFFGKSPFGEICSPFFFWPYSFADHVQRGDRRNVF